MKLTLLFLLGLTACSWSLPAPNDGKKILLCYYGSWAVYRPGKGAFAVDDLDPHLCTHITYGFAGLNGQNKIYSLDPYCDLCDDYGMCGFTKFTGLKKINPDLKTILAIGGWNEGSTKYSKMASDPSSRKTFIDSVVAFLTKYGFDGLDMDWEYPGCRGGKPEDRQNYISLLQEMRAAFDPHGFIITAALSAGKPTIDVAYDIPKVSQYLDILNVMCYDYHGSWEMFTGVNTPMFPRPGETGDYLTFNVNFTVNYWISQGADPKKMTLGTALYGNGWELQDNSKHDLYDPAQGPIQGGPYTQENGMWGYNEICEAQKNGGWEVVTDPYYMAPYTYKGSKFLGYDTPESIAIKATFANEMGLAGAMVWSIDTDDFKGVCGDKFPLAKALRNALDNSHGVITPPPYPPTTTPDPLKPTTKPPGICTASGFFRDPNNCEKYYECVPDGSGYQKINYDCGSGMAFDPSTTSCKPKDQVPGCS